MATKVILVLFASVLLVKTISGQCISRPVNAGCGNNGLTAYGAGFNLAGNNLAGCNAGYGLAGNGYAANIGNIAPSSGSEFLVYSSSAVAPSGVSVVSENSLEGTLNVAGALPFLSAVALEGQVASGGSAGVSYSYGNGNVGIIGENGGSAYGPNYSAGLANTGLANGLSYGCGIAGLASAGLANYGLAKAGIPEDIVTIGTGCGGLYY